MKVYLQKLIGTAVLSLALLANSLPAWAGAQSAPEVVIYSSGDATGSMAGARYSGDNQQYIGCYILGNSDFITCLARDKTGKSSACYGDHPKWKSMVKAITDFSYLRFSRERDSVCSSAVVTNNSQYLR